MTPSELSSLEEAYEKDPEGTWYALHDAYLECEPPREREAARVAMKQRRGWRWWRVEDARGFWLGPTPDDYKTAVGFASRDGPRAIWEVWKGKSTNGGDRITETAFAASFEAAKAAAEDWLLDHGY